ncbi:chitobiase/beta-hexosaminidase C-terminal domain-containing protein [Anaerohalosphaeraceae bacterium U12dextr]
MERHGWGFRAYVCAIIFLFSTFAGATVQLDPVAMPVVSVPGGTYHVEQNPVLTCATPGAIIRYTLDGTDPNDGLVYEPNALIIDRSVTLKAVGLKEGMSPSPGLTVDYRVVVATPKFKPEEGIYFTEPNEIVVTISCATPGAVIHYTTDGNDPTESDPVITSGDSLYLDCGTTLKARAWKEPMEPSEICSSQYALYVSDIRYSLSPVPIYNTEQTVTLTCWTPGAVIHYTTNGMDPTENDPAIVSGQSIDLDRSMTLKARGWKAGYNPSQMLTLSYKLVAATPEFSVAGGTYNTEQTVTITCATPDAVIHYTTNGMDPTDSDPVIASGDSLSIDRSMTLKARAWKGSLTPSVIRSENYNMVVSDLVFTPDGGRYETEQTVTITCATPGAVIYYTTDGTDPAQNGTVIENGGTVMVAVNPATTLKAIALKDYLTPSSKTAVYAQAFIIYVNASATGANTGASWADAFTDLQSALDAAIAGDEIWVAAGTYKPTKMVGGTGDRFKAFQLKNDVGVYGGFNGTETDKAQRSWEANPTILSGDLNGDDNDVVLPTEPTRQDNCYHVFNHLAGTNLTASAVLDGFVITGGNGTDTQAFGGGMYNYASSPTIINCTFRANSAAVVSDSSFFLSGGAILNYYSSSPAISHCVFTENYGWYGGGVCNLYSSNPTISDCVFNHNTAVWGGGICNPHAWALSGSKPVISRCTFQDNTATVGGGIFNGNYTQMVMTGCTFSNNSSGSSGGGIHNGNYTSLTMSNCVFDRNSASSYGGGVIGPSLSITNCIFSRNSAAYSGGGLAVNMSSNSIITNSIFYGNSSGSAGGGLSIDYGVTLNNCIVWGNTAGTPHSKQITLISGMSVNYCNIQGQIVFGLGNIDADPLFVDAANGNFRLQPGSPCIDAGINAAIPAGVIADLAGTPRIVDGNCDGNAIVDMGAYEYFLPGDLNTTCTVNMEDLSLFSPYWLAVDCTSPDNCGQADIDRNGMVDLSDFAILAGHWMKQI